MGVISKFQCLLDFLVGEDGGFAIIPAQINQHLADFFAWQLGQKANHIKLAVGATNDALIATGKGEADGHQA